MTSDETNTITQQVPGGQPEKLITIELTISYRIVENAEASAPASESAAKQVKVHTYSLY